jgi:hypothetical protein
MWKSIRPAVLASAGLLLQFVATSGQAELISDTVEFETQDQSMWSEGGSSSVLIEQFLGTRWGQYRETGDNPLADLLGFSPTPQTYQLGGFVGGANTCVGVDTYFGCAGFRADTTTGASLELTTSGRIGVFVGAELFGGGVDVTLPVNATIGLPNQVTAGEFFTVTTSGETLAQGAEISANAPSFRAYIDGVFDTENHFFGEACALGSCVDGEFDVDINLGRFDLVEVDSSMADPWTVLGLNLPGVPLAKLTKRAPSPTNPDGIDETPPIDPTPEPLKPPVLLEVEISGLQDKTGGTLQNGSLGLTADHDVFDAKLSLTGFAETFLRPPGSPAILKNKITLVPAPDPIPDLGVTYTIANVEVGPVLSLRQNFDLTPVAAVRLQFDVPVTRMELVQIGTQQVKVGEDCFLGFFCTDIFEEQPIFAMQPVTHFDGVIEILLGENATLAFNHGIGELVNRTYVMTDSTLRNTTSLLGRLEATAEFGCLEVPGIGDGCIFDQTWPTGNISLGSSARAFRIGGFNEVEIGGVFGFNGPAPATVPEPGTWILFLLGLAAILSGSRRNTLLGLRRVDGAR